MRKELPDKLALYHSRRVGVRHGQRLQDQIPAEALPTQEVSSTDLHREGRVMQAEIQSMLQKQAISLVEESSKSFYSQMFLVPKKDSRQRPVINLKKLNQSVKTEHFKMEGIHMLKDLPRAGDWMAKIDLNDASFMIPIALEDRDFRKF
jgi:hypothetical protein